MRNEIMIDILLLAGLSLLGYGLWLYEPWVSFSVVGFVMIAIAVGSAIFKNNVRVQHVG